MISIGIWFCVAAWWMRLERIYRWHRMDKWPNINHTHEEQEKAPSTSLFIYLRFMYWWYGFHRTNKHSIALAWPEMWTHPHTSQKAQRHYSVERYWLKTLAANILWMDIPLSFHIHIQQAEQKSNPNNNHSTHVLTVVTTDATYQQQTIFVFIISNIVKWMRNNQDLWENKEINVNRNIEAKKKERK